MQELIRIEGTGGNESVNARDLHEGLEVGKVFGTWIQDRIEKYGFTEGRDYVIRFPNLGSENRGGLNKKEYHLTINMAKELAMVENNEKGRQIRQYFINVEEVCRQQYKKDLEARVKSKEIRNTFTDQLKDHGLEKPIEYIKITATMKKNAGIPGNKKKTDMDKLEIARVSAYEALATLRMIEQNPYGYEEVKPVCQNSAMLVGGNTQLQ